MRTAVLILSGLACVAVPSAAPASAQTTVGPSVTLPDSASAPAPGTPYPSPVTVTGEGIVTDVNVRVSNFTHDFPADADFLLTGPGGQSTLLLSDAGGSAAAASVDLAFDDEALGPAPDPLVSGTYKPTDVSDPSRTLSPPPRQSLRSGPVSPSLITPSGTGAGASTSWTTTRAPGVRSRIGGSRSRVAPRGRSCRSSLRPP